MHAWLVLETRKGGSSTQNGWSWYSLESHPHWKVILPNHVLLVWMCGKLVLDIWSGQWVMVDHHENIQTWKVWQQRFEIQKGGRIAVKCSESANAVPWPYLQNHAGLVETSKGMEVGKAHLSRKMDPIDIDRIQWTGSQATKESMRPVKDGMSSMKGAMRLTWKNYNQDWDNWFS